MAWTHQSKAIEQRFPGKTWESTPAQTLGMSPEVLDQLADELQGWGCVVKDGYIVKSWGEQHVKCDLLSSAKPIFSTLLFFAIEEGHIMGVSQRLTDFGWKLSPKDQSMELFHLANMTSGYRRPEKPGEAWAYNDPAIRLYLLTLFSRAFKEKPKVVVNDPDRFGALGLEDGLSFGPACRVHASLRDFARIGWFWLNKGNWNGRQVLPQSYFDEYMKPQTPPDLPPSGHPDSPDYLKVGTFGGKSAHFTEYGAGIYGFNWWFNATGRLHPDSKTWPDAPDDAFMSIGLAGNNSLMIPSRNLMLVTTWANWGKLKAGDPDNRFNAMIRLLLEADAKG